MKKNYLKILLSVLLIAVCVFALVACNNDQDTDKSFNNADFVNFRKKIVTILKDNGIFVNDIDAQNKKTASTDSGSKFKLMSNTAKAQAQDSIGDILAKPEFAANNEDFDFAIKQIFGMSLKMSLCLGDGISNYFGETSFFDIAVNMSDSYMSVSESGDTNTVRAFYPSRQDYNVEIFDQIDVKFTSATDYSFKSLSIQESNEENLGSSKMYASGNAQKQLLIIYIYGENEAQAIYSPDGASVYSTEDIDVVNQCLTTLGDGTFDIEKDKFYANRTNVKYTFTDEQFNALTDKYFKDIQSSTAEIRGIKYRTVGGIKFADDYTAADYETTVEIPTGTEYISDSFVVYDKHNTVKSLYIPKSVKGIVQLQDPKTGQEYATPKILTSDITARTLFIALAREDEETESFFDSIGVENGSPLFKSGNGHLITNDGNYIYLTDTPLDALEDKMFERDTLDMIIGRVEQANFKNLFQNITEIDIDVNSEQYIDRSIEMFLVACNSLFSNLERISFHGTCVEQQGVNLELNVYKNISIDIDLDNELEDYNKLNIHNSLSLRSGNGKGHRVTIQMHGFTLLHGANADGVNVTVKMQFPRGLYDSNSIAPPQTEGNVTVKYAEGVLDEKQEQLNYSLHTRSGKKEIMAIVETKEMQGGVTIPSNIGMDVTALMLYNSDSLEYVEFGSNIKYIVFNNDYSNNLNYTVKFNGTYEDFEKVQIICYGKEYSFNLSCNGKEEFISGGKQIPENERCTITVKYTDDLGLPATLVIEHAKGRTLDYTTDPNTGIIGGNYVVVNSENLIVGSVSMAYRDPEFVNPNFGINISKTFITGDATFSIILEPDRTPFEVNIQKPGFTLTGKYDGYGFIEDASYSLTFSDGYVYKDNGAIVSFNEFGIAKIEIGYYKENAEVKLELKIVDGHYVIEFVSFTLTPNPDYKGDVDEPEFDPDKK